MGFDTYKFVVPAEALKVETELNLGYCKEIQRGNIVVETDEDSRNKTTMYYKVDWDTCTKMVSFNANPEDTIIDISDCKGEDITSGYDMNHHCRDGILDISKCMGGRV